MAEIEVTEITEMTVIGESKRSERLPGFGKFALAAFVSSAAFAVSAVIVVACAQPAAAGAWPGGAAAWPGRAIGAVPAGTPIKVVIALQGRHESEIPALLRAQNAPGSPLYRRWLTPAQFGAYFGAEPASYARIVSELRARGFVIDRLEPNRLHVIAHAPAAALERTFATTLDVREDGAKRFYANRDEPRLPAALNGIVAISGLDDYGEHHSHLRSNAIIHKRFSWAPADLAVGYDLNALYGQGLDGSGETIANATAFAASPTDLAGFDSTFGLPAATLQTVNIDGSGEHGGDDESTLDVDMATSVARGATFVQVAGGNAKDKTFDDVYAYIVNDLGATVHVVTTSWGSCEPYFIHSPSFSIDEALFEQASTEGQTWFSASGDDGTDDCYNGHRSVDYPGSSPYVISVGGTNVTASIQDGNVTGWESESTWQASNSNGASGGGKSIAFTKPDYQTQLTPADGARDVPDVSALADDVNDGVWIFLHGKLSYGWGGTSDAAPMWAGLYAIVLQKYGGTAPYVTLDRLYQIGASSAYASAFHDITTGNNHYKGARGYDAVPGYDQATGLGSFDGAGFVNAY
jgi:kumamolisin